jgi:TatD DNase family protein
LFSDAHCHFRHLAYDAVELTVKRIEKEGIELALLASVDVDSSRQEILTAKRFSVFKACIGIHPWNADLCNDEALRSLRELSSDPEVLAMSEIGLDYFEKVQQTAFREQLRVAKEMSLPVIIHDRTSSQEVLDILEEEGNAKVGAAIHGFNKDLAYAKRCVEMGVYISVGFGTLMPEFLAFAPIHQRPRITVVSEKARDVLKEVIRQTDLKWLLTDSDRQGYGVFAIAEKIAEIKGLTRDDVGRATTQNLKRLVQLN